MRTLPMLTENQTAPLRGMSFEGSSESESESQEMIPSSEQFCT
jgi:hypothetical protein